MATVEQLLEEHKDFLQLIPSGRVQCIISKHEMPKTVEAVSSYLSGKKFLRLKKKESEKKELKQYEPYLVPSKFNSEKLFCRITGRLVAKTELAVVRHSEGRRFTKGIESVSEGSTLLEEPSPEEVERRKAMARAEHAARMAAAAAGVGDEDDANEQDSFEPDNDGARELENEEEEAADFWIPEFSEEAKALRRQHGIEDSEASELGDEDGSGDEEGDSLDEDVEQGLKAQTERPQKKRKVKCADESQSTKGENLVGGGKAAKKRTQEQPVEESEDGGAPRKKKKKFRKPQQIQVMNKGHNKGKLKADIGETLSEARTAKGATEDKRKRKSLPRMGLKST